MSEHTPGPWTVNPPPDTYLEVVALEQPLGCTHICGEVDSWPNARLIAAAPDLLEAAESVRDLLKNRGDGTGGSYMDLCDAIAKARGEKS